MPHARAKLVCRRSRAERKWQRRKITLEDASLSDTTRHRYTNALLKLLPVLETVTSIAQLDFTLSEWVEAMWKEGEALYLISDALCGLHYYEPWTKRQVPNTWRLFSAWRKLEVPARAPPLTSQLVRSMVAYALHHDDLIWASLLLLGFYGLLRTGEILKLAACDILIGSGHLIISLLDTKTGKRKGGQESIHIDDPLTFEVTSAALALQTSRNLMSAPLWPYSGTAFRKKFAYYCARFGLQKFGFRPYSLRRGGATSHFQQTRSMESSLLLGRWESIRVARIYISDALSFLPGMSFSTFTKKMLCKYPSPL